MVSHWNVLGVQRSAGRNNVRRAYRRLALRHHPNKGGNPANFRRLQNAYERAMANLLLRANAPARPAPAPAPRRPSPRPAPRSSPPRPPASSRGNTNNGGCVRQFTAKYTKRPSPPYPANSPGCRGTVRQGNDGQLYRSTPNKNGVFTWKRA